MRLHRQSARPLHRPRLICRRLAMNWSPQILVMEVVKISGGQQNSSELSANGNNEPKLQSKEASEDGEDMKKCEDGAQLESPSDVKRVPIRKISRFQVSRVAPPAESIVGSPLLSEKQPQLQTMEGTPKPLAADDISKQLTPDPQQYEMTGSDGPMGLLTPLPMMMNTQDICDANSCDQQARVPPASVAIHQQPQQQQQQKIGPENVNTLEQLKIELENITHAHVPTVVKPITAQQSDIRPIGNVATEVNQTALRSSDANDPAMMGQLVADGQLLDSQGIVSTSGGPQVLQQLQQQMSATEGSISSSENTTTNTRSQNTSVYNSRRTSADFDINACLMPANDTINFEEFSNQQGSGIGSAGGGNGVDKDRYVKLCNYCLFSITD